MSEYFKKFKALIDAGHDPDTSPEIAALDAAMIKKNYGGHDRTNVSAVGVTSARVAMFDEDRRELEWHQKQESKNT